MNLTRFFAPTVLLEADGEIANELIPFIKSFEFKDEHKKPDEIRISFINENFRWLDDKRFRKGVVYRVKWGYPTLWSEMMKVRVQKALPTFPKNETPLIHMTSWDSRIDMSYESSAKNYGPVSSSEVARVLAKKWGLKMDIDESNDARKQARLQSTRYTDLAYLVKLADDINFRFDVVGDTLVFKRHSYDQAPYLTYTYFTDKEGVVLSFTPEVKEKALKKKLGVSSADAKHDYKPPPGVGYSPVEELVSVSQPTGKALANVQKGLSGSTAETSSKVAAMQAAAAEVKVDLDADKAKLVVVGDPRLRKGRVIRMEGVGPYCGPWYVAGTDHKFGNNVFYTTEVKLQRGPLDPNKPADQKKPDGKNPSGEGPVQESVSIQESNGKALTEQRSNGPPGPPKAFIHRLL